MEGKCQARNTTASDRNKAAIARHRTKRERKKAALLGTGVAVVISCLAYSYYAYGPEDQQDQKAMCGELDKECNAAKLLPVAMDKCSEAITRALRYEYEWSDSLSTPRFDSAEWYVPGKSIIYTGSELKASNAFGAKERVQYFCVVSVATGLVQQSGTPSLQ